MMRSTQGPVQFKASQFMDDDNSPDVFQKVVDARERKRQSQKQMEELRRRIACMEAKATRIGVAVAVQEHREKVQQTTREAKQYNQYLHWLKEQEGDEKKDRQLAAIGREKQRKELAREKMIELFHKRQVCVQEMKKAKANTNEARRQLAGEVREDYKNQIWQMKNESADRKVTMRNQNARHLISLSKEGEQRRAEASQSIHAHRAEVVQRVRARAHEVRAHNGPTKASRNLTDLPHKRQMLLPKVKNAVPAEDDEIDRYLAEMKEMEEIVRHSRRQLEVESLKVGSVMSASVLRGRFPAPKKPEPISASEEEAVEEESEGMNDLRSSLTAFLPRAAQPPSMA
uniref:Uncharacterized protein n=1 Tax=Eutreptiella gymnastica TaxID=73025 RepID=A0A7S1NW97_9EUGL|mmetsp:Transcript_92851/g.160880  ORF Transcript_92851/g.160880 Transcript_92851/m.160880 type:complete len:343 (+) Transcript_92851:108-1136(+)